MMRPSTIPNTKRQVVQNATGQAIERAYLYLLPTTWQALKALCASSSMKQSELIEQLILNAVSGNSIKDSNDTNHTFPRNT